MSLGPLSERDRKAMLVAVELAEDLLYVARRVLGQTAQPAWKIPPEAYPTTEEERTHLIRDVRAASAALAGSPIEKKLAPWREVLTFKADYDGFIRNVRSLLAQFKDIEAAEKIAPPPKLDADQIANELVAQYGHLFRDRHARADGGGLLEENMVAVATWLVDSLNGGKPAYARIALKCTARKYDLTIKQASDLLGDGNRAWVGKSARRPRRPRITPR